MPAGSSNTDCYVQDRDYAGNDLQKMADAASAVECQQNCQALPDCKFFTYVLPEDTSEGQDCFAKTSDAGSYVRTLRVSGPQYCP